MPTGITPHDLRSARHGRIVLMQVIIVVKIDSNQLPSRDENYFEPECDAVTNAVELAAIAAVNTYLPAHAHAVATVD